MSKQTKFILAIIAQLLVIFVIIIFKIAVLAGGTEVLLRIEPIDPRDPLRGDYITFQYSISNVYNYYDSGIKNGDTVYVQLRKYDGYWGATSMVSRKKPKGDDKVFIKGVVESGAEENELVSGTGRKIRSSNLHIVYGIEEYFIPEGKGRNFSFQNKEIYAKVALDENGNAVIKQIYVDGEPWP